MKKLLLTLGNPLREDDGIGHILAEILKQDLPDWSFINTFQLLPEHLYIISEYDLVIILDAECAEYTGHVKFKELKHNTLETPLFHEFGLDNLASYLKHLPVNIPDIKIITVTSKNFAFKETISEELKSHLGSIKKTILSYLESLNKKGGHKSPLF
ncbi:MAG: hydrogenase maturation protease [Calditerrivibrio sp.]|nr:hydrogenase maturation protease [Calditerrivibrio sp.]